MCSKAIFGSYCVFKSNFGNVVGELLRVQRQIFFFLEQSIVGGNSSIGNFIPFFSLFCFYFFVSLYFILFYCGFIVA